MKQQELTWLREESISNEPYDFRVGVGIPVRSDGAGEAGSSLERDRNIDDLGM